jgi:hypothetical protein
MGTDLTGATGRGKADGTVADSTGIFVRIGLAPEEMFRFEAVFLFVIDAVHVTELLESNK